MRTRRFEAKRLMGLTAERTDADSEIDPIVPIDSRETKRANGFSE